MGVRQSCRLSSVGHPERLSGIWGFGLVCEIPAQGRDDERRCPGWRKKVPGMAKESAQDDGELGRLTIAAPAKLGYSDSQSSHPSRKEAIREHIHSPLFCQAVIAHNLCATNHLVWLIEPTILGRQWPCVLAILLYHGGFRCAVLLNYCRLGL
jgi:hypothetical protein